MRHLPSVGPSATAIATLAAAAFIAAFLVPPDYDYWWHLADGRYVIRRHALPSPDPFSFTAAGRPVVVHEWLAEVPMYLLHQKFGIRGPYVLFALCTVAIVLLTFLTLRQIGTSLRVSTALAGVTLAAVWPFVGARPQVAGLALLAALFWLLERWIERRDASVWALPLVLWLWGNLHGSFAIGLALPAFLLCGELLGSWLRASDRVGLGTKQRLQLGAGIVVSAAALLVNPNGFGTLAYPLARAQDSLARQVIAEWRPSDISNPSLWPFALLAGGYMLLLGLRRPLVPLSDLVIATLLVGAALSTQRYVPYAAIVLAAVVGRALSQPNFGGVSAPGVAKRIVDRQARHRGSPRGSVPRLANLLVLVGLAAVAIAAARRVDPMATARREIPVATIDQLGAGALQGPLFNDYDWGGHLMWRFWPDVRVFVDGRFDVYLQDRVVQEYFEVVDLGPGADSILDRYGIRTVLYPADSALARYLLATGRWRTAYDDGGVVTLVRRDGVTGLDKHR